jgi:hypothetical protein
MPDLRSARCSVLPRCLTTPMRAPAESLLVEALALAATMHLDPAKGLLAAGPHPVAGPSGPPPGPTAKTRRRVVGHVTCSSRCGSATAERTMPARNQSEEADQWVQQRRGASCGDPVIARA